MANELVVAFPLFWRRCKVHPAGAVMVALEGVTATPATIRSPPRVPAGTAIVSVSAVPFRSTNDAARNAMAADACDARTRPATRTISEVNSLIIGCDRRNIVSRARAFRAAFLTLMLHVQCEGHATARLTGTIG